MKKEVVKIQTNNVNINKKTRGNKPKSRSNNSARPLPQRRGGGASNRNVDLQMLNPPIGIQTGLSRIEPESVPLLSECESFTEHSKQFLQNYSDPCGEHGHSIDAARVPDGALETSAGGFFRRLDTIFFPWQSAGSVSLDGSTYSLLIIQPPLFRALAIIIAKRHDGELTPQEFDDFCVAWASIINREDALYPNFVEVSAQDDNQIVFTVMDASVMRTVVPPNELGVSEFIQQYRITSQGMNIMFNTPDLLDQATIAGQRYVTDQSVKSYRQENEVAGARLYYLPLAYQVVGTSVLPTTIVSIGGDNPYLPQFSGVVDGTAAPFPPFPSPEYTAEKRISNGTGTFNIGVGDTFQYIYAVPNIKIINVTTGDELTLITLSPLRLPGTNRSLSVRLYEFGNDLPDTAIELDYTVLSFAPILQSDSYQQNVKTAAVLAKETGGLYLPSCIYEPVFKMTSASNYRKVLFTTPTVDIRLLISPNQGWFDTVDSNFSTGLMNWQSIPYACKPYQKFSRSVELVPAPKSVVGLFTTGPVPEQPEVIDMCKNFSTKNAQGFPANYNGMGILFGKVLQVCEQIPNMLRTGHNIARKMGEVIDKEIIEESLHPPSENILRGFKRLMARV